MNRVGDVGLALAMFVMFANFGTMSFAGVFAAAPGAGHGRAGRDRPAAAAGRMRQVGAGAAAVLARRRDGRPHAGVGADPRRHHGDRRRVPDRAVRPGVQPGAGRTARPS